MDTTVPVTFSTQQMEAFSRISHDNNPLHTDSVYARFTPFGQPVVYGMLAVAVGLGHWANGRIFNLAGIKGRFLKPIFPNEPYTLKTSESGASANVQYLRGSEVQCSFTFMWRESDQEYKWNQSVSVFEPLLEAKDARVTAALLEWKERPFPYSIGSLGPGNCLGALKLRPGQLPWNQFHALLGSSYLIGMESPGRQALYAAFEFDFESADSGAQRFELFICDVDRDDRLNRWSISGRGTGIRSFHLNAYERPKPVNYSHDEIQAACGKSEIFKGQVAFVSGATRGFGSVLARMFALHGASVAVNYRANQETAEALISDIRRQGGTACAIRGDVSESDSCAGICDEIGRHFGKVDILVANAFPLIFARNFLDQSSGEFLNFLGASVSSCTTLLRALLPMVPPGGTIIQVSTVFTHRPERRFAHYVAAKCALEGVMRVLAAELPDRRFIILRAPRMLTDQTNLPFDLAPPRPATEVAGRLLQELRGPQPSVNLCEVDVGE